MAKYFPQLIGLIQSKIQKILSDSSIHLAEVPERTGKFGFVTGTGIIYQYDNDINSKIGLIPIQVNTETIYWISVHVRFNTVLDNVDSISFSIYSDSYQIKLFRAEWTNNIEKQNHAQPHWHIQNERIYTDDINWEESEEKFFKEPNFDDKENNLKKIHFAMSSNWHCNQSHVVVLTECSNTEIVRWVEGVLIYIIYQLKYLHKD